MALQIADNQPSIGSLLRPTVRGAARERRLRFALQRQTHTDNGDSATIVVTPMSAERCQDETAAKMGR